MKYNFVVDLARFSVKLLLLFCCWFSYLQGIESYRIVWHWFGSSFWGIIVGLEAAVERWYVNPKSNWLSGWWWVSNSNSSEQIDWSFDLNQFNCTSVVCCTFFSGLVSEVATLIKVSTLRFSTEMFSWRSWALVFQRAPQQAMVNTFSLILSDLFFCTLALVFRSGKFCKTCNS